MMTDPIITYTVRRYGECAYSDGHRTLASALRDAAEARRVIGLRYYVFAEHKSGATTGPYSGSPDYGERE